MGTSYSNYTYHNNEPSPKKESKKKASRGSSSKKRRFMERYNMVNDYVRMLTTFNGITYLHEKKEGRYLIIISLSGQGRDADDRMLLDFAKKRGIKISEWCIKKSEDGQQLVESK